MEKRLVTAVLVSIAFLWLWAWAAPKIFPDLAKQQQQEKQKAAETATTSTASSQTHTTGRTATSSAAPAAATSAPAAVKPVAAPLPITPIAAETASVDVVDTADYIARFSNRGAELLSFKLKHYTMQDGSFVELVKARPASTDFPFFIETGNAQLAQQLNSALYKVNHRIDGGVHVLEFRYAGNGVSMTKTFRLGDEYQFAFASTMNPPAPYRVAIGPGLRVYDKVEIESRGVITGNGVVQISDSLKQIAREKAPKVGIYDDVQFIGIEDNFFLTALKPEHGGSGILHTIDLPTDVKNAKDRELVAAVNAANDGTLAGNAFFGPKQTQILDRYGYERTLQYGTFGLIARFFLTCLLWINKYTHNYGWAIIVLTILIKAALYPLQHKWMMSMKKMQKLAPKQEAIKAKYKKFKSDPDQRQKMNTEMMKLYQQEGVNPAGGCLPMLIQFPIFIGFYNLLSHAIELRGQPWILWIHDLSLKDPYYITPLLMTVAMFVQQMITPSTADPAQKRMFMFMPLIFGFIFKEFPSGLVIYWLVQNLLTILQQVIMNKFKDPNDDNRP
jgi:YidC/Oxa1 family membrane protein insertase